MWVRVFVVFCVGRLNLTQAICMKMVDTKACLVYESDVDIDRISQQSSFNGLIGLAHCDNISYQHP